MRLIITARAGLFRDGLTLIVATMDGVDSVAVADDEAALFGLLAKASADTVLLDVGRSNLPCYRILERLRGEYAELGTLVLSADREPATVRTAIEHGATGYLLKSAGTAELQTALRSVSDGHPYVQAELVGALVEPLNGRLSETHAPLSPRRLEIVRLLTEGCENKQIARQLGMSETTVKSHLRVIYAQLDAASRAEAVAVALRLGLVT